MEEAGLLSLPDADWLGAACVLSEQPTWPCRLQLPLGAGTRTVSLAAWQAADFLDAQGHQRLVLFPDDTTTPSANDAILPFLAFQPLSLLLPRPPPTAIALDDGAEGLLAYAQLLVEVTASSAAHHTLSPFASFLLTPGGDSTMRRYFCLLAFIVTVLGPHPDLVPFWLHAERKLVTWLTHPHAHGAELAAATTRAWHAADDLVDLHQGLRLGVMFVPLSEAAGQGTAEVAALLHVDALRAMQMRAASAPFMLLPELAALGRKLGTLLLRFKDAPAVYAQYAGLPRFAPRRALLLSAPNNSNRWQAPRSDAERRERLAKVAAAGMVDLEDLASAAPCMNSLLSAATFRHAQRFVAATWFAALRVAPVDAVSVIERNAQPLSGERRTAFLQSLAEQQRAPAPLKPLPGCAFIIKQGAAVHCPYAAVGNTTEQAQRACCAAPRIFHPLDHVLYQYKG